MGWQRHREASARVSVLLHPLAVGTSRLLWRDWSRREHRRACWQLVRSQRVEVNLSPLPSSIAASLKTDVVFSRAQRTHTRLSWETRLARNAWREPLGKVTIKLFGVPNDFAHLLSLMVG
jgi:hypothetical protein